MAPIPTPEWFVTFLNDAAVGWGGVLISQDHVLTAGHTRELDGLPLRVGTEDGFTTAGFQGIGGADLKVVKISPAASPKSHTPLPLKTLSDGPLAVYLANQGGLGYLAPTDTPLRGCMTLAAWPLTRFRNSSRRKRICGDFGFF